LKRERATLERGPLRLTDPHKKTGEESLTRVKGERRDIRYTLMDFQEMFKGGI
jgi:hypothetical protein